MDGNEKQRAVKLLDKTLTDASGQQTKRKQNPNKTPPETTMGNQIKVFAVWPKCCHLSRQTDKQSDRHSTDKRMYNFFFFFVYEDAIQ